MDRRYFPLLPLISQTENITERSFCLHHESSSTDGCLTLQTLKRTFHRVQDFYPVEKDRANRLHFRKFPASHCAPLAGSPVRAFSLRSLVTKTRMQRHGSLFPKEHPLASYRPTTNLELPGLALRGPGGRPSGRSSAEGRVERPRRSSRSAARSRQRALTAPPAPQHPAPAPPAPGTWSGAPRAACRDG